ncbi:MAG: 4Fe-4S binding protein [Desulfamplus sp.]|nr:4Fe-4S binding protein [Desulfamplus sp.]
MKNEKIYRELQKHLDTMPVGFPSSKSGADMKLLRHIFTPEEARIACFLTHKPETINTILERIESHCEYRRGSAVKIDSNIEGSVYTSIETLTKILDQIQRKGGIESRIKDGKRYYCNLPLVVGIYEMQVNRLTTDFLEDFSEYSRDINFGLEFLSLKKPQMRTIPIQKSIMAINNVSHFDEVLTLFEKADPPFVVLDCICRKKNQMAGNPCKVTDRQETCIAVGDVATTCLLMGVGREISREESVSIVEKNQKQGLVLQPSNTEELEFICSCCGCCCGMLNIYQKLPIPIEFWSSNFYAVVDKYGCNGCGVCEKRCQVEAVKIVENKLTHITAFVDLNACLGCGLCVPTCPQKAMRLVKKEQAITPPKNREDLHEIIMADKKAAQFGFVNGGRLNKLKVVGKLARGIVKTGKIDLLKKRHL